MRSKEVEGAIRIVGNVKIGLMNFGELINENVEIIGSIDTTIAYISKLEKENLGLLTRLRADSLIDRDNYWKDKIRDKIKELEEKYVELSKNKSSSEKAKLNHEYIEKRSLLESLLGE